MKKIKEERKKERKKERESYCVFGMTPSRNALHTGTNAFRRKQTKTEKKRKKKNITIKKPSTEIIKNVFLIVCKSK